VNASELAELVEPVLGDALVAFDVDGVLAPIVEHTDDSRLLPGTTAALSALARRTTVAILSGRSLESLERLFAFPAGLQVIGSHGLEVRDAGPIELDDDERYTIDQLELLGTKAVEAAGDGAWLEYKPASVVAHIRLADPALADPALDALTNLARMIDGAQVKAGHKVVELLARHASKGIALLDLARRLDRAPIVYVGDDLTDEDAFGMMGAGDISVRVGPGETVARFRVDAPADIANFLRLISAV
jgi:trehalose-phosphatase